MLAAAHIIEYLWSISINNIKGGKLETFFFLFFASNIEIIFIENLNLTRPEFARRKSEILFSPCRILSSLLCMFKLFSLPYSNTSKRISIIYENTTKGKKWKAEGFTRLFLQFAVERESFKFFKSSSCGLFMNVVCFESLVSAFQKRCSMSHHPSSIRVSQSSCLCISVFFIRIYLGKSRRLDGVGESHARTCKVGSSLRHRSHSHFVCSTCKLLSSLRSIVHKLISLHCQQWRRTQDKKINRQQNEIYNARRIFQFPFNLQPAKRTRDEGGSQLNDIFSSSSLQFFHQQIFNFPSASHHNKSDFNSFHSFPHFLGFPPFDNFPFSFLRRLQFFFYWSDERVWKFSNLILAKWRKNSQFTAAVDVWKSITSPNCFSCQVKSVENFLIA